MKLPRNGKVIVIDNEPKEAEPLLKILSRNKIPYIYYTGETDFLPIEGDTLDDVRVIFLDINLTQNAVGEAISAQLNSTLRRIIKPGIPYIAAIWSNNQEANSSLIEDLFSNKASDIAPISKIFLNKGDFFQYNVGEYILDPDRSDIIGDIEKRINDCLNEVDSIRLLIEWENSVSEAINETVLGISKIIDTDCHWNDNLKHIYYKLAHAQLGKTILNHNDHDLQQSALNTITSSFNDRVEMKIANISINPTIDISNSGKNYHRTIEEAQVKLVWDNFTYFLYINGTQKAQSKSVIGLKANNSSVEQEIVSNLKSAYSLIFPKLNSELLISKSPKVRFHPGNVYKKTVTGIRKRKLLKTYFPKIEDKKNGKYIQKEIFGFQFVEVECTPICDYSQSKRLRYRFLPGILFEVNVEAKLDDNIDSIYKEIPPFEFRGKIYRLVFDYRLFKAINKDDVLKINVENFLFRLKIGLLIDIQARISSHVSRPGIITVS